MNRYIGWALLIAFFLGIHLSADQAITVSARPAIIPAKGSTLLRVIVARNPMNRTLLWEVDGWPTTDAARSRSRVHRLREVIFLAKSLQAHFDVRVPGVAATTPRPLAETSIIVVVRHGLDE